MRIIAVYSSWTHPFEWVCVWYGTDFLWPLSEPTELFRNLLNISFIFQPHPRPDMIDKKVIDGHIIPDKVVFTASAPNEEPFETIAFEDNIKVTVTFFTQGEGKNAKSNGSLQLSNFGRTSIDDDGTSPHFIIRFDMPINTNERTTIEFGDFIFIRNVISLQLTSNRIQLSAMQNIPQVLLWLKSYVPIFQWKTALSIWFIARWWLLIQQLCNS